MKLSVILAVRKCVQLPTNHIRSDHPSYFVVQFYVPINFYQVITLLTSFHERIHILIGYSQCLGFICQLFDWLFIITLTCCTLMASVVLLFYWLFYSAITEHKLYNLGLIALSLFGLMYDKLNHYMISHSTYVPDLIVETFSQAALLSVLLKTQVF